MQVLPLSEGNNSLADQDRCTTYAAYGALCQRFVEKDSNITAAYGSLNNTNCGVKRKERAGHN